MPHILGFQVMFVSIVNYNGSLDWFYFRVILNKVAA